MDPPPIPGMLKSTHYFTRRRGPSMFRLDADKPVEFCDGLRRRDFLHAGSLSFLGLGLTQYLSLKAQAAVDPAADRNCIMLFLVGGPSQLDTWDMKPNA